MNRRFVITADWHFDLFINLNVMNEKMLTPQAKFLQQAIEEIKLYMVNNHIGTLIVAGDIYHRRNLRPDSINNLVDKVFSDIVSEDISVYVIPGNHDQANQSGSVHGLERLLSTGVNVVSYPSVINILGFDFVFIPYMEHRQALVELEKLQNDFGKLPKIFVGHLGIDGAKIGTFEKKLMEPIRLQELHPEIYVAGYLGHYHHPQKLSDNFRYTGAPVQHNLGDSNDTRGFWDISLEKTDEGWEAIETFVPIDSTPKFYQIPVEDFSVENYRDIDFVKVTGVTLLQREELRGVLPNISFEGEEIEITKDEIILSISDNWEKWIEIWVRETEKDKRSQRRLERLGKEIMEKVRE